MLSKENQTQLAETASSLKNMYAKIDEYYVGYFQSKENINFIECNEAFRS